jgi:CYTH domain-containing protein
VRDAAGTGDDGAAGAAPRERYFRTVKLGSGVTRIEVEEGCTRELFDALWPLTRERRVRKRRYRVPDGALVWEVDEFTDRPLVVAEVELPAADAAAEVPGWLAPYVVREVTDEGEYVNANLARPADGD